MECYTTETYTTFVRQHLEALSPALVAQLRTLIGERFHPRVNRLRLEVRPDSLTGAVPLLVFTLDEANFHVMHNSAVFPLRLLTEVEHVIPPTAIDLVKCFDEAGVETIEVELQTLIAWVAACWIEAGGREFSLAASIGIRGDIESFDLKHSEWVSP